MCVAVAGGGSTESKGTHTGTRELAAQKSPESQRAQPYYGQMEPREGKTFFPDYTDCDWQGREL